MLFWKSWQSYILKYTLKAKAILTGVLRYSAGMKLEWRSARIAALSHSGEIPVTTLIFSAFPSLFTMNFKVTLPCIPAFLAVGGYSIRFHKPFLPPINTGILSVISYTLS